jgi:cytoskeletal protein RodZ
VKVKSGYKEKIVERRKGGMELDPVQMEDMKKVGELLHHRRKEMNLSLKEAENATSIRITYLQALEEGEMNNLISPIYAQGFFKQYAAFLGIDGDQIVRDHPGVFNRPEIQEFAYGIGTLEGRGNPGSGVKWFPNALWILAFVLIVMLAWYMARLFGVLG